MTELGRFLQLDPIGFEGDPLNLYRYAGHNPTVNGGRMGESDDPFASDFYYPYYWGASTDASIVFWAGAGASYSGIPASGFGAGSYDAYQVESGIWLFGAQDFNINSFTPFTTPEYTDGHSYWYEEGKWWVPGGNYKGGHFQTVGVQTTWSDRTGWATRDEAAATAIDSSWSFTNGIEWAGVVFQNPNGRWAYTIAMSEDSGFLGRGKGVNSRTNAWVGPDVINGEKASAIWHPHVDVGNPKMHLFSLQDVHAAGKRGVDIYMGDLSGRIWVHGPDSSAIDPLGRGFPGTPVRR